MMASRMHGQWPAQRVMYRGPETALSMAVRVALADCMITAGWAKEAKPLLGAIDRKTVSELVGARNAAITFVDLPGPLAGVARLTHRARAWRRHFLLLNLGGFAILIRCTIGIEKSLKVSAALQAQSNDHPPTAAAKL